MFPLPAWLRAAATGLTSICGLKDRSIPFPGGNMVTIAVKPGGA
jgi:hypothetical protein